MIEHNILHNLITNDEYARKTLPFIRTEFFSQPDQKILFRLVNEYFEKYNSCPNKEALRIELNDVSNVDQTTIDNALQILNNPESEVDEIWLLDQTERFCQDKAIYNAIMNGINILENKPDNKGQLPQMLQEALFQLQVPVKVCADL